MDDSCHLFSQRVFIALSLTIIYVPKNEMTKNK